MATDENNKNLSSGDSKKLPKPSIVNKHPMNDPLQISDPIIAKVIKDAFLIKYAQINNEKRKLEIDELGAMFATCQEFMQSFIILGYDLNGHPIQPIVHAHNQQEADALGTYLNKFLHSNIQEIDFSGEP
jgi:hypothetical protein